MRELVIGMLWMTSLLGAECETPGAGLPPIPPRTAAAEEKIVSDGPAFWACDATVLVLAVVGGEAVTDRRYSVGREWGHVLRAKVRFRNDSRTAAPVVCWSKPGEKAQLWVDMSDPGG
jgi:hypothetical protein